MNGGTHLRLLVVCRDLLAGGLLTVAPGLWGRYIPAAMSSLSAPGWRVWQKKQINVKAYRGVYFMVK